MTSQQEFDKGIIDVKKTDEEFTQLLQEKGSLENKKPDTLSQQTKEETQSIKSLSSVSIPQNDPPSFTPEHIALFELFEQYKKTKTVSQPGLSLKPLSNPEPADELLI